MGSFFLVYSSLKAIFPRHSRGVFDESTGAFREDDDSRKALILLKM